MKKKLQFLSNRVVITGVLVFLQIAIIVMELLKLGSFYVYISILLKVISVIVMCYLIYKPMNPEIKLAWIVPVLLFPLLGGAIFLLYGHVIIPKKLRGNMMKVKRIIKKEYEPNRNVLKEVEKEDRQVANQFHYIEKYGQLSLCKNSKTTYYPIGEAYFEEIIRALEGAEHFIFLEYFIIKEGKLWTKILDILKRKVKEGVEVRVMFDDVGSGFWLPSQYHKVLEAEGIKSVAFNKLFPFMALILNNRDHRKIVVVDGKVAFTGGINIADEYINAIEVYGHWKDTGIKVEGDAVWHFTFMFLQLWNTVVLTESDYSPYKYDFEPNSFTDGYIAVYGTNPLERERLGETVYFNMINGAKKYLYIYTPYLVVDYDMTEALKRAAKRGVDVRIVTPGIPDKKKVYWLTQSSYRALLKAGVRIMQYKPGFIHGKCILCDDELATVGTINFDYRSFYHHFECGALLYRSEACIKLKEDMLQTFKVCEEVDEAWCETHITKHTFLGIPLKLFSPLL